MNNFKLTKHASDRIQGRLSCLVSKTEILKKIESRNIPGGRSYIEIKRIKYTEIQDESVKPDGVARGDQVVAIIDNDNCPRITTIILRKSWSQSAVYNKIIK
jgi:hypothetical protein